MLQLQARVQGSPRFDEIRYSIHDFSSCDSYVLSSAADVDYSAAIDDGASSTNGNIKIAIVAAKVDVMDIVGQYVNRQIGRFPVRFFASLHEAREWVAESSPMRPSPPGD
jgi:hypothetical protein